VLGISYNIISDTTDAQSVAGPAVDSLGFVWQEVMGKLSAKF
jgi:hypothetical protein